MTVIGGGGCGCGQRRGPGMGCSCARASAAGVVHDGAFTRPSFFEGQLLTADDLQAMTAYVRSQAEGLDASQRDIEALAAFYTAALAGLVLNWLRNGMKTDVDALIAALSDELPGALAELKDRVSVPYEG